MSNIRKQMGATLLELTMAIGIIATIAIAAIAYFNTANDSSKINDEVKNVNTLTGSIRNMFNSQGNYEGLTNEVVLTSGAFPDRMRVSVTEKSQIKHSWLNDGVTVLPTNFQGTANDSFTVLYKNVPARACVDLVSKTFRFYDQVDVDGTVITNIPSATTACGQHSAGNKTTVNITFTAR